MINMVIKKIPRLENCEARSFCLDDCIATYAHYIDRNYEVMYMDVLRNSFEINKQNNNPIGSSIIFDDCIIKNLKKYVGLEFLLSNESINGASESIKRYVKNKTPVLVEVKGFNCPWDWRYKMVEQGSHMMFIIGYIDEDKKYVCLDPYYDKQEAVISEEEFNKAYISYRILNKIGIKSYNVVDLIYERLEDLKSEKWLGSMKMLPKEIEDNFNINVEVMDYCHQNNILLEQIQDNIPLNFALKKIIHNRVRFCELLNYVDKCCRLYMLKDVISEWKYISQKWSMLRLMFIKKVFSSNEFDISGYISKKIAEIICYEEELLNKTVLVIKGKLMLESDKNFYYKKNTNRAGFKYLDLSLYMNNAGMGNEMIHNANLNGDGEYFIKNSIYHKYELKNAGMKFELKCPDPSCMDNISCSKQLIEIGGEVCNSIMILGCSEYGNCIDDIVIKYLDDSYQKLSFTLKDWVLDYNEEAEKDTSIELEKVEINARGKLTGKEKAYLYAVKLPCNNKSIKTIELPECANMHIFAITLEMA